MIETRTVRIDRSERLFEVVIETDEDGKYVASCPDLQACYTQGDTLDQAIEHIREVIAGLI